MGGLDYQHTHTVNAGTVRCKSPNPSALGALSAGHPMGPSVDLYNVLLFAVGELYIIKIRYTTANNFFSDVLQSATWIMLVYMFWLLSVAVLAIDAANRSVMSTPRHTKP
jgi:hypothetical protein